MFHVNMVYNLDKISHSKTSTFKILMNLRSKGKNNNTRNYGKYELEYPNISSH